MSTGTKKWAILVVHGVGDTAPGNTLKSVANAMECMTPPISLPLPNLQEDLPEREHGTPTANTFPMYYRRGQSGADKVVLAELYWADLTRAGAGTYQFVVSLVGFVFGLRHLVLQSGLIPGCLGTALTTSLRLALFLLLGPVSAIFVVEFVLYLTYRLFIPQAWDVAPDLRWAVFVCQGLYAASAIIFGWAMWRRDRPVFWPCLASVGVLALAHVLLRASGLADEWYTNHLIPCLNTPTGVTPGEWPLTGFIMDYVLDRLLAIVACCLIVAGFVVVLARFQMDRASFRSMSTAWLAMVLLDVVWEVVTRPLDLIAQLAYDQARGTTNASYTLWYNECCVAALTVALLASAAGTAWWQIRWARRLVQPPPARPNTGGPPRLIVAFPIQICLLLFAGVFCPVAVLDGFDLWEQRWGHVHYGLVYFFYLAVVAASLGGSLFFRNILHILNDIATHFQTSDSGGLFRRSRYGLVRYAIRQRIARRLRLVTDTVLSREEPTHLIVIAHSQGTIIALEEFRRRRWASRFAALESVTILTFGSPFTHLYQRYFPLLYGDVTKGKWKTLRGGAAATHLAEMTPATSPPHPPRTTVRTWVNVYRADDYVGTFIASPDPDWPQNVQLPPGLDLRGHTRYWEADVFNAIRAHLPS